MMLKQSIKAFSHLMLLAGLTLTSSVAVSEKIKLIDPTPQEKELMQASMVGDIDTVKALVAKGISANSRGRYGKSALMFAVEEGSDEVVDFLISKGADVNALTTPGCTALTFAAEGGYQKLPQHY